MISYIAFKYSVKTNATATIDADGQVDAIAIGNSGYGYNAAPTITIAAPSADAEQFRALGFATI